MSSTHQAGPDTIRSVRASGDQVVVGHDPRPTGDGVQVNVVSSGICGSDIKLVEMAFLGNVVLGHEFAGRLNDGTPVAVEPVAPDGTCDECARGNYHRCRAGMATNIGIGIDGGMRDQTMVPERSLFELPTGLSVSDACLVEPTAVALHGLRLGGVRAGQRVGVIGGGVIGLMAAAGAKALGAEVGLAARHPAQIAAAEALGIGPCSGEYDVMVESAGSDSAVDDCVNMAGPGGTVVILGTHMDRLSVPGVPALLKELNVVSSIMYNRYEGGSDFGDAINLHANDPVLARTVITHRFPLEKAVEAFKVAADRKSGALKVVLEP
ncbi:MAG TPA: alcohol dehydrogenase catalytic domain-containing protein [Ilumatobacteraceae bacterium]|nr:alcohol dehydrogenase catalytic domain-containing protein [Ilumatobacteraceae bacterium]